VLLQSDLQTIFFARSRNQTEVLLKYLRDECEARATSTRIASPATAAATCRTCAARSRRACARGAIRTVVSTNALELGVDIGSLDVCVLVGYPGTVSSTFQRAGRVGRRTQESAVVLSRAVRRWTST
jgi:DEAD/DEAH box helicase domain-containing protein